VGALGVGVGDVGVRDVGPAGLVLDADGVPAEVDDFDQGGGPAAGVVVGAGSGVVGLGIDVTTLSPARCRLGGLAEHEAVGGHAHVRDRPPLAVLTGREAEE
jgi:hypothetical protein